MLFDQDQIKTDDHLINNRYAVVGLTNFSYPRTNLYIIRSSCQKGGFDWHASGKNRKRSKGIALNI